MRHSNSFDRKRMGLDFGNFLPLHVDHLDRARSIILSDTREDSSSAVEKLNLGNVDTGLVGGGKVTSADSLNCLVDTRSINN